MLELTPSAVVENPVPIAGRAVVIIEPSSVSIKKAAATVNAIARDCLIGIVDGRDLNFFESIKW